jgi:hypothetical protein
MKKYFFLTIYQQMNEWLKSTQRRNLLQLTEYQLDAKSSFVNRHSSFLFFVLFFVVSCEETPYRLESRDRVMIDSTSNKMIENLAAILEDSCKRNFDSNVKRLTDSIVEFQIKEIDKKLQLKQ